MPAATEKKEEAKKEVKPVTEKKEPVIEHLTEEERQILMDDSEPVDGYAKAPVKIEEAKEEKPAEPVKKEEPKSEEKPKEEKKVEEKAPVLDPIQKIEVALQQPEGKEDLTDFTPREKAYFYQMRRDRKARQKAEEERDQALFRESKLKSKPEEKEEDPLEVLKGKDPTDILTVEDVQKIFTKMNAKKETKPTVKDDQVKSLQVNYLKVCEREARALHPEDFDAVIELTGELIENDPTQLRDLSTRVQAGENPALVMYDLVKGHKEFDNLFPAAETRVKARQGKLGKETPAPKAEEKPVTETKTAEELKKEEDAKLAEKKLEENQNKPKTTAHVASNELKPADELTMEEIAQMSDLAFSKLPRQIRQRYLKRYGN